MPRRDTAYWIILSWIDEQIGRARLSSDNGAVVDLERLKVGRLVPLMPQSNSNRLFFRALANQKDPEGLFKWFLSLIGDSTERDQIKKAARKIYGAGQPPF